MKALQPFIAANSSVRIRVSAIVLVVSDECNLFLFLRPNLASDVFYYIFCASVARERRIWNNSGPHCAGRRYYYYYYYHCGRRYWKTLISRTVIRLLGVVFSMRVLKSFFAH